MPRKRIDWTEFEQDTLFNGARDLWQQSGNKSKTAIDLVRMAQIALPEGRRRQHLQSITNLPKELQHRLVVAEIGKVRFPERLQEKSKDDPNLLRINQLADERDQAIKQRDELLEQNKGLSQQVLQMRRELQSIPTEAQVVKTFIADILWDVESRKRALPGPTSTDINKVVLPKVQEEPRPPRHEPEPEQGPRKPKLVVVGGRPPMHNRIHEAMKNIADMRYVEEPTAGWSERFKAFKDPTHGKVVLWTTNAAHQLKAGLEYHNIPYVPVSVTGVESLIDTLKQIAKEI